MALALFLAGCAVGPAYHQPALADVAPSQWHTVLPHNGSSASLVSWWQQFNDPVLSQLIELSESGNPTVAQAVARIEQAVARIEQARASASSVGSAFAGTVTASQSRGNSLGQLSTTKSASLDLGWELDVFGGKFRATEAADARAQASVLNWHQARVSLAAEVASTYFALRQNQAAIALAEADVTSRKQTLSLVSLQVKVGAEAPSSQDRAEASLAESISTLEAQRASCVQSQNKLALLTALPAEKLSSLLASSKGLPAEVATPLNPVPAQVLAQRPDVAAAERLVAAASADIGVAQAALLPSLKLGGVLGVNTASNAFGSTSAQTWSFGPTVTLPLLDGGQSRSAVASAQGRYAEAYQTWRQTVLTAVQDVEDALSRVDAAHRRFDAARMAADRYDRYFAAMQAKYNAGAASLLELEDARRLTLTAQQSLLSLNLEQAQARVALYKAAGGGWAFSTEKPVFDTSASNEKQ